MSDTNSFTVRVGVSFSRHIGIDRQLLTKRVVDTVMPVLRGIIRDEDSVFFEVEPATVVPSPPVEQPRGLHEHVVYTHGDPRERKECGRLVTVNLHRGHHERYFCEVHGYIDDSGTLWQNVYVVSSDGGL